MRTINKNKKSFTLIELLVVITILAVLAAVAIPQVVGIINQARNSAIKADMRALQTAAIRTHIARGRFNEDNHAISCQSDPAHSATGHPDIVAICDRVRGNSSTPHLPLISHVAHDSFYIAIPLHGGGFLWVDHTGSTRNVASVGGNWVWVPGGFWIMQFEAKYDNDGNRIGDDANWAWGTHAGTAPNLPANVISTPEGRPIAHITHTEAIAACEGMGGRLITNSQWMRIARNAEMQTANWGGGAIGSPVVASTVPAAGGLRRGNVGMVDSASANEADPASGPITGRDVRSRLILSNGSEIWDISGNVWEHVFWDDVHAGVADACPQLCRNNQPIIPGSMAIDAGDWGEFNTITAYQGLSFDAIQPRGAGLISTHGVGQILSFSGGEISTDNRVFGRGGTWYNGAHAGAFSLILTWGVGVQGWSVGFRCVR